MEIIDDPAKAHIALLENTLRQIKANTVESSKCCESLSRTARHLNNLTSPATDYSSKIATASRNVAETQVALGKAREMFDATTDCELVLEQWVHRASAYANAVLNKKGMEFEGDDNDHDDNDLRQTSAVKFTESLQHPGGALGSMPTITEQDIEESKLMMRRLKEAYDYFERHEKQVKACAFRMESALKVFCRGLDGLCMLIAAYLVEAGQAIRLKGLRSHANESAQDTRKRLTKALHDRNLLKAVGEYEEYAPMDKTRLRLMRAMFESLAVYKDSSLHSSVGEKGNVTIFTFRSFKSFDDNQQSKLLRERNNTGYLHLDVYAQTRGILAFNSLKSYHARLSNVRVKTENVSSDAEARDIVRCLEHTMVIISGEKAIFRAVITPSPQKGYHGRDFSRSFRAALYNTYSHVAGAVIENVLFLISSTLHHQAKNADSTAKSGEHAASALRILDGVRILGPSLSKICELSEHAKSDQETNVASNLCIHLHRTAVKGVAKALEFVTSSIVNNPAVERPFDGNVAAVTSGTVHSIKVISIYATAYKSVTKRRSLPWDPKTGAEAEDMDTLVRYLISKLVKNLDDKVIAYQKESAASAKAHFFYVTNSYYLLDKLKVPKSSRRESSSSEKNSEPDHYTVGTWFKSKIGNILEREQNLFLEKSWKKLNAHLVVIDKDLSEKESSKLLKNHFTQFNQDFEKFHAEHLSWQVYDIKLQDIMQTAVKESFLPRYQTFFETYSQVQFSKRKIAEYLKYPPDKVELMIEDLYDVSEIEEH